jgi:hypothetical protein
MYGFCTAWNIVLYPYFGGGVKGGVDDATVVVTNLDDRKRWLVSREPGNAVPKWADASDERDASESIVQARGMAATTPQTPRRSKRHHPVVFTTGNPSSLQAPHDKWASPPLHTRSTTSADLVEDEESTVDATTTFYSDFLRSSRATGRSGKGPSEKYSIGDTVLLATNVQRPSVGVIIALWEVSRHVANSHMFANIHWFLRPGELARTRTKREHLDVRLFISTFYFCEFTSGNLH